MKMHARAIRLTFVALAFLLLSGSESQCSWGFSGTVNNPPTACNDGENCDDNSPPTLPSSDTTVRITPDHVAIPRLGKVTLYATVTFPPGSTLADKAVVWKVDEGFKGGVIDQEGRYAAPHEPGIYHVTATSVADPEAWARAVIRVKPAVEITPGAVQLLPGTRQQFTARIVEAENQEVVWSIDEGQGEQTGVISKTGLLTALNLGTFHVRARAVANPELTSVAKVVVSSDAVPVFEPPQLDPTVSADMQESVEFLYTGTNPVQIGVEPEVMNPIRIAVIRGRVKDLAGNPLSGVLVTVKGHPEYGSTRSRVDGLFDLAVNGDSSLVVDFTRSGFLRVQRPVEVPAQDWVWADDVVMTPYDAKGTAIDFRGSTEAQVAEASEVNDESGRRRVRIVFPPGVRATVTLADGTTRTLQTATVRATEYTVGPTGPAAMPGPLPPGVAYTYAAELSLDEAEELNARQVDFSAPVSVYLDNFLGFQVGTPVPAAYYDREAAEWVPEDDGHVLAILGVDDQGRALIDAQGNGAPETAADLRHYLGLDDGERVKIAQVFGNQLQDGPKTFWRVQHTHFTPVDYNWPAPEDAIEPGVEPQVTTEKEENSCSVHGSIIECENQVLGQRVHVAGTPYFLAYNSSRVPGHRAKISVELTGEEVHVGLHEIQVTIGYAGHFIVRKITSAGPNMVHEEILPRQDAYNRDIKQPQTAWVSVQYLYDGNYLEPDRSGRSFGGGGTGDSGVGARAGGSSTHSWSVHVDIVDARSVGLGGWTLSPHHQLQVRGQRLLQGDGAFRKLPPVGASTSMLAGCRDPMSIEQVCMLPGATPRPADRTLLAPRSIAHMAGTVLVSDWLSNSILQVQDGHVRHYLRTADHHFTSVGDLAVRGSDLYFVDGNQVLKADAARRITVVAGGGQPETGIVQDGFEYDQDGLYAPFIGLSPNAIAVDPAGTLYVASSRYLRRVGADQTARVVRRFSYPIAALASHPAGGAYVVAMDQNAQPRDSRWTLWRASGISAVPLATFEGPSLEEARAVLEQLRDASVVQAVTLFSLGVSPDGEKVYIGSQLRPSCMRMYTGNGAIEPFIGTCDPDSSLVDPGEGSAEAATAFSINSIDHSPEGLLRFVSMRNVYEYRSSDDGILIVASEDGRLAHRFDRRGRHIDSVDALLGGAIATFAYDTDGRLSGITDRDGRMTVFSRHSNGLVEIESPDGIVTGLELNAEGYLARVVKPGGADIRMSYASGNDSGLMAVFTDERDYTKRYHYDDAGLLIAAVDAAGGRQDLRRTRSGNTYSVTLTSGERRRTVYEVERVDGRTKRTVTAPGGLSTTFEKFPDGRQVLQRQNGLLVTTTEAPDPRFGAMAPVTSTTMQTPGGRTLAMSTERYVTLADESDPLSVTKLEERFTGGGETTLSEFDVTTRTWTTTSPAGRISEVVLDSKGRVATVTIPGLEDVVYGYDPSSGRLTSVTQGNRTSSMTYDLLARLEAITDAENQTTTLSYTPSHRIASLTLPDLETVSFSYDATGNLTTLTPPGKPAHSFSYDARGLTEAYTPPTLDFGDPSTTWSHDAEKKPVVETRPDGVSVSTERDNTGRVRQRITPSVSRTYTYDESTGQLVGVYSTNGWEVTKSYDAELLLSESWRYNGATIGTVAFDYDTAWRRNVIAVNDTPATYLYDDDGLLVGAGGLSLYRDSQNGLLDGTTIGNVTDAYQRNYYGEVERYTATAPDQQQSPVAVYDVQFERDLLGRIVKKTEAVEGVTREWTYAYDDRGRLFEVHEIIDSQPELVARYGYDVNGNRTSVETPDGSSTTTKTATYDDQDRLLSYGTTSYTYTPNGELATKVEYDEGEQTYVTTSYAYDPFGNLLSVTNSQTGPIAAYDADGLNRRIERRAGSQVQRFLYDGQLRVVAELDGSNNVVSRFIYADGINSPEHMVTSSGTYRFVKDHLGSPRLVVDVTTGVVAQRMEYDAWGVVLEDSAPGFQPFGFAGGLYDAATGLVRFGARDYDPEVGRWTAKDPIGFAGGTTLLYEYSNSDPVNYVDPTGLLGEDSMWKILGAAIAGTGGLLITWVPIPHAKVIGWSLVGLGAGVMLADQFCSRNDASDSVDKAEDMLEGPGHEQNRRKAELEMLRKLREERGY